MYHSIWSMLLHYRRRVIKKKREPRRIETRCGRAERRCPWVGTIQIYISIMIHLFLAPAAPEMSYQMCYRIATARSYPPRREQKTSNAVSMSQWKLMKFRLYLCAIYLCHWQETACDLKETQFIVATTFLPLQVCNYIATYCSCCYTLFIFNERCAFCFLCVKVFLLHMGVKPILI